MFKKTIKLVNYFKETNSLEYRKKKSQSALVDSNDSYPVTVILNTNNENINKFKVLKLKGNHNIHYIAKSLMKIFKAKSDQSYIVKVEQIDKNNSNIIWKTNEKIKDLYKQYKDEDGFLYLFFNTYDAFGSF